MWSLQYWKNVAEMAVTGAAMGVAFAMPDWHHADWLNVLTYAGAGALALAAKSVVSNLTGPQRGTPLITAVKAQ